MLTLKKKATVKTVIANGGCKCRKATKDDCRQVYGNYGTSAVQSANTMTARYN